MKARSCCSRTTCPGPTRIPRNGGIARCWKSNPQPSARWKSRLAAKPSRSSAAPTASLRWWAPPTARKRMRPPRNGCSARCATCARTRSFRRKKPKKRSKTPKPMRRKRRPRPIGSKSARRRPTAAMAARCGSKRWATCPPQRRRNWPAGRFLSRPIWAMPWLRSGTRSCARRKRRPPSWKKLRSLSCRRFRMRFLSRTELRMRSADQARLVSAGCSSAVRFSGGGFFLA